MHFLAFITADIENIKLPSMEGLDDLVAVRVFLVLLGTFMVEIINPLIFFFPENEGFDDKWPPWSQWFVNFLICQCYECHCFTSLLLCQFYWCVIGNVQPQPPSTQWFGSKSAKKVISAFFHLSLRDFVFGILIEMFHVFLGYLLTERFFLVKILRFLLK